MNRMDEIANSLGQHYRALRMLELALGHKRQDLDGRKLYLAPAEGWPGKNENERKTAAEKCYAEDDICKSLAALIRENEGQIAEQSADSQALEAWRRGLEWDIRQQLVDALRQRGVQEQNHGPVECDPVATAFDNVLQDQADELLDLPF